MHAIAIVRKVLSPFLKKIHSRRLDALFVAIEALFLGGRLSLTALGRNCAGPVAQRHQIKRIDRLLGNQRLHGELPAVFGAVAQLLLRTLTRPLLLVDWTQVGERQWALVAAVAVSGRALPIYVEVHRERLLANRRVERRFLKALARLLPSHCRPVIVTDAGFRNPWFLAVRELGWDFVGRLGKNVKTRPEGSCQLRRVSELFDVERDRAVDLGMHFVTERRPMDARLVVYKARAKGRKGWRKVNRRGVHPGSSSYKKYQRRAAEPWVLVTSLTDPSAAGIVSLYARRMQIEETFRDAKSHRFGWSFEDARSRYVRRLEVLLLLATIGMLAAMLVGNASERADLQYEYQASTTRRRRVLSLFTLGAQIVRRGDRRCLSVASIREALRQVASLGCAEHVSRNSLIY